MNWENYLYDSVGVIRPIAPYTKKLILEVKRGRLRIDMAEEYLKTYLDKKPGRVPGEADELLKVADACVCPNFRVYEEEAENESFGCL